MNIKWTIRNIGIIIGFIAGSLIVTDRIIVGNTKSEVIKVIDWKRMNDLMEEYQRSYITKVEDSVEEEDVASNENEEVYKATNSLADVTIEDVDSILVVAMTLWGEAQSESDRGLYAAASVIYNRAGGDWGKVKSVCLASKQFSVWNGKRKTQVQIPLKDENFLRCWRIAVQMFEGSFTPNGKWNCYYNPRKATPEWRNKMKDISIIGRHKFGIIDKI